MNDTMEWAGTVRVFGGVGEEGQEYRRAKIHRLGDEYKLSALNTTRRMAEQVDRLLEAKVTADDDGNVTFVGISETLIAEVGLAPEASNVRWEMKLRGCQSCS